MPSVQKTRHGERSEKLRGRRRRGSVEARTGEIETLVRHDAVSRDISVITVYLITGNVKDAQPASLKPILTFASPGFIRLLDHLKSLKSRESPDPAFLEERKLYGLGTLSSEVNYEWDAYDASGYNSLTAIENILGWVILPRI